MTVRLSCRTCGEEYVALGYTDEAVEAAVQRGPSCCPPDLPASEVRGEAALLAGSTDPAVPTTALLLVAGLAITTCAALGAALGALMTAVT